MATPARGRCRGLRACERILHLGDVGRASILEALEEIAPVTAVRGNVDREGACAKLPETEVVLVEGHYIYMLHDLKTLASRSGGGEVCGGAARAHPRAELSYEEGRALFQSRLVRAAAV